MNNELDEIAGLDVPDDALELAASGAQMGQVPSAGCSLWPKC